MNIIELYIDESGFTGNNLLDEQQKNFCIAAVTIDNKKAKVIIEQARQKYRLQATELKAKNMLKTSKGREACVSIIDSIDNKASVIFFNKKYNLCCKYFEYLFEPIISRNCEIFYRSNFHKYIANSLYFMHDNQDFFNAVQHFLRNYKNDLNLSNLYKFKSCNQFLNQILTIIESNETLIINELQSDNQSDYLLDLTDTAVYCLCCDLSKKSQQVKVICDESKAIDCFKRILDAFVGSNIEHSIIQPNLETANIIPNLSASIEMADSKTNYSIQLADILAGTVNHCYLNIENPINSKILKSLHKKGVISGKSTIPEDEFIDTKLFKKDYDAALNKMYKNALNKNPIYDCNIYSQLENIYRLYAAAKYLGYC